VILEASQVAEFHYRGDVHSKLDITQGLESLDDGA
jgi:hypothetical protein